MMSKSSVETHLEGHIESTKTKYDHRSSFGDYYDFPLANRPRLIEMGKITLHS